MADTERGEQRALLQSKGGEPISWPVVQPEPRFDATKCCPWFPCFPLCTVLFYILLIIGLVLLGVLSLLGGILCGLPAGCFCSWTWFWRCFPFYWKTDLYQKMIYMSYWGQHRNVPVPVANEKFMPVSGMKPKGVLKKYYVDYAVNLQVPAGPEDQFLEQYLKPSDRENLIEHSLPLLPQTDFYDTETFGPEEDPVEFVMRQLAHVYPTVYQEWGDKQSDQALSRFCFYGVGAHRVEPVVKDGKKMFVFRTNMLAGLPVRPTFEKYGGDAYFDENWAPVMIIDDGLSEAGSKDPVITRPGDEGWHRAKFRFRSSLFTLVTLVDHLYGVHLQTANLFVTALREQMSAEHPIRRFLTPFTYQSISVNDNAKFNLTAPKSMGPRCFAFTDKGVSLAFAAAPYLLKTGETVPSEEGGPILNIPDYVKYLKKIGVDTEYWRQVEKLVLIFQQFIEDYLECYYDRKEDVARDAELQAMAAQYFDHIEHATPDAYQRLVPRVTNVSTASDHQDAYLFYVKWLASLIWSVTGGHEQLGAVEVYAQDVSWTSFKWLPGATVGTKTTATSQALLMSFTSTPMPKLLGEEVNWTHLFPRPTVAGKDPAGTFKTFQKNLQAMADQCDEYNAKAASRPFPHCFPVYTQNPRVLEVSLSV